MKTFRTLRSFRHSAAVHCSGFYLWLVVFDLSAVTSSNLADCAARRLSGRFPFEKASHETSGKDLQKLRTLANAEVDVMIDAIDSFTERLDAYIERKGSSLGTQVWNCAPLLQSSRVR